MREHNHLYFALICVALAAFLFWNSSSKLNKAAQEEILQKETLVNTLNNTPVLAKAISIYSVDSNKKIYGKNDTIPMPIASLAKILTIALAVNNENKNEILTISKEALDQAGDFGFFLNEKWRIEDLAKITLISSANDSAYLLGAKYLDFLDRLNLKARKLGASQTVFSNFTGLDIEVNNNINKNKKISIPGVEASAEEVNQMAMFLFQKNHELASVTTLPEITVTSESGFVHTYKNTDIIVNKIPNLLFSKTGFTDIAGGNLTIIFKNKKGERIAITLLGSTFAGRFDDMEKLVNVLYNS
jgi:D-alanyl-D-alanine carboxypeptidase